MKRSFIKAFTLVELLVVIAILAILSTVGIIGYNSFTEKAYVSNDETRAELINRHLQMYQLDNPINSEDDLKIVIDEMYGEEAFNKLEPQSAKYGYHYWFNIETKQVKLSKVEDLNASHGINYLTKTNRFDAKGSLRASLVPGFLLLDRSGSDIANALSNIDIISSAEDYENVIKNTIKAKNSDNDGKLGTILEKKLETTSIVSNDGTFRYSDVTKVDSIYYTVGTNSISSVLHEYDGKNVITSYLSNVNNKYIATGTHFVLPSNIINVSSYSFFFDENNIPTLSTSFEESQLLEVFKANATNAIIELTKDEVVNQYKFENGTLKNITTGVEIGTPDYSNPVQDGDFIIKCLEDNNGKVKQLDKLYVAYDQQTFNLKAEFSNDEVSSKNVYWEAPSDFISIDDNGLATITKLPEVGSTEARIIATAEAGGHSEEITVYIVRPTNGSMTLGGLHHFLIDNNEPQNTIDINYDGEQSSFIFSDLQLINNINVDNVSLDIDYEITTSGDLFEIVGNNEDGYTLNLKEYEGTQELTITVGDYFTKTFTINVIDNSASPFELKFKNTDKYMYRLGNANEVSLSSLFALTEGKDISNKDVTFNIYDASKTTGDNKLSNIATKGEGFKADYDKKLKASTWENSIIKFNGSGVAILEIGTGKLVTRLVVEVIDGVNVSTNSELIKNHTNNIVLLSNFELTNDNFTVSTFSLSNANLYGNGFEIKATDVTNKNKADYQQSILRASGNCNIDNIKIVGGVYPSVQYSKNIYYVNAILVTSGNVTISNSIVANTRSPIKITSGDVTLDNTIIDGGVYSNIEVTAGNLILQNVTTIQSPKTPITGESTVFGAGIIFGTTDGAANSKLIIKGELNQYNWVSKDDYKQLPDKTYQYMYQKLFNDSSFDKYKHNEKINLGVIFVSEIENFGDKIFGEPSNIKYEKFYGYVSEASIGYGLYSIPVSSCSSCNHEFYPNWFNDEYNINKQNNISPSFEFTNIGSEPTDPNSEYFYYTKEGILEISYDDTKNPSYSFNCKNGVIIQKYLKTLEISKIECEGATLSDSGEITFDSIGDYVIKYYAFDSYIYNENGQNTNNSIEYEFNLNVKVKIISKPDAIIDVTNIEGTGYWGKTGSCDADYYYMIPILKNVKITDNGAIINGSGTTWIDGLKVAITRNHSQNHTWGIFADYNNVLYLCSDKATADSVDGFEATVVYYYTGVNGNQVSVKKVFTFMKSNEISWKAGNAVSAPSNSAGLAGDNISKTNDYTFITNVDLSNIPLNTSNNK